MTFKVVIPERTQGNPSFIRSLHEKYWSECPTRLHHSDLADDATLFHAQQAFCF